MKKLKKYKTKSVENRKKYLGLGQVSLPSRRKWPKPKPKVRELRLRPGENQIERLFF